MPFRELQCNLEKSRQHVHVFVPIEVRWQNPRITDFPNLRVPLNFDFRQRESAPRAPQKQAFRSASEFALVVQKTRNAFRFGDGGTVAQIQMHSYPQAGSRTCRVHAPSKCRAVGEQRSAGDNSAVECLDDAAVYALGPPEVIRVDNQVFHCLSHSIIFTCPLGQLLVCANAEVRTIDPFRPQL